MWRREAGERRSELNMKISIVPGMTAALLVMGLTGCGKSGSKTAPPVIPPVSVAHPIPRKVNEWDEFTGRLASPETVEVRARVPGYLEKVHFKEGSDVAQGDLLFTIANLSRKLGIEPETALRKANDKFARRFGMMERTLATSNRSMRDMTLEELEQQWQQAKSQDRTE